ncbi:uncharacterized protein LOC126563318 [Anopheles maculipalpis]|uniref:uncharacterized protein LOC126563318 n=1 Tax=Anopheles maculipalpis TaxID=1496333 RepID=UPI002158C7D7|nr:uncharacterized protein LOC126563318 [Anopheles maculipalpis]
MSYKKIVFLAVCSVLLVIASTAAAVPNESKVETDSGTAGKSYFGYHPKPKDSYKKLVEDVDEFARLHDGEFAALLEKIQTLHKKLFYRKDKDHGGHYYNEMEQMQKLLIQQKAALDALRSERPSA